VVSHRRDCSSVSGGRTGDHCTGAGERLRGWTLAGVDDRLSCVSVGELAVEVFARIHADELMPGGIPWQSFANGWRNVAVQPLLGAGDFRSPAECHAPGIIEAGRLEEGDSLLPVKYTDELKARAVELVIHAQADPDTANGAITRVAKELGLSKETLRVWVRKHKESGEATPTESVDLETENRRLRAELAEAKRANEILRRASAFFAAELDRPSK
jgi:transposase